jgi:molybdopterin molybdotransferase
VLAKPLAAAISLPLFDASAMDGFAVRGHPPWTIVGTVGAWPTGSPGG